MSLTVDSAVRPGPDADAPHVVSRLKWRMQDASQMGFHVRCEPLQGRPADWCQIGQRRLILLDAAATAGEQLQRLEEILRDFQRSR